MTSFEQRSAQRARLIEQMVPVRLLKYLRRNFDNLILAYSGGTDSTLLALICIDWQIEVDQYVFGNTLLEYEETLTNVELFKNRFNLEDKFNVTTPELSASEIAQMVVEDFDKAFHCMKRYDKSDYRCCYHAKEVPMKNWLRDSGYDEESTCILRGLKLVDSSGRMLSGMTLIEYGKFYYYDYKYGKHAKCSNPIQLVTEERKDIWLRKLCGKYEIPIPEKSGCSICPIFYKMADKKTKDDARLEIARRFFDKKSPNMLPYYTKDGGDV